MALGLTQPLTEMSTRNISGGGGGKGSWCVGLTTLPPYVLIVLKCWSLNLLEPSGSVQTCNGIAFLFTLYVRYDCFLRSQLTVTAQCLVTCVVCGVYQIM
jgi:hypothetical protein